MSCGDPGRQMRSVQEAEARAFREERRWRFLWCISRLHRILCYTSQAQNESAQPSHREAQHHPRCPSLYCHTVLRSDGTELEHRFEKGTSNWGWQHFMETKVLRDKRLGFIEDGWSTLIACLSFKEIDDQAQTATAAQRQAQALMLEKYAKLIGGNEIEKKKKDDASVNGEAQAVDAHRQKCV